MLMKMVDGVLYIKEADQVQLSVIRSWGTFRWIKSAQMMKGPASRDSLNRIAKMVRLPPYIEEERKRINAVQDAVDRERTKPESEVKCYVKPPVKKALYIHQQRAFNMALLTFGIIEPEELG